MADKPRITICMCNPSEEAWFERLAIEYERECEEHDLEQCVVEDMTLHEREPVFFEVRAEADPYWPPKELDHFEEVEPEGGWIE